MLQQALRVVILFLSLINSFADVYAQRTEVEESIESEEEEETNKGETKPRRYILGNEDDFEVRESNIKHAGSGLFAKKAIPAGTYLPYSGEIYDRSMFANCTLHSRALELTRGAAAEALKTDGILPCQICPKNCLAGCANDSAIDALWLAKLQKGEISDEDKAEFKRIYSQKETSVPAAFAIINKQLVLLLQQSCNAGDEIYTAYGQAYWLARNRQAELFLGKQVSAAKSDVMNIDIFSSLFIPPRERVEFCHMNKALFDSGMQEIFTEARRIYKDKDRQREFIFTDGEMHPHPTLVQKLIDLGFMIGLEDKYIVGEDLRDYLMGHILIGK